MIAVETYLLYLGAVLVFFAHPPGPSQLLFVGGSIQHGVRRALPIMAGDLSANAVQILIAGFGLASLLSISASVFGVIKWAGIAYLVWIGLSMIREARQTKGPRVTPPRGHLFRKGFLTSAANPYAVVFFAALFPQFIDPMLPVAPQILILGLTYLIIDGAILLLMGSMSVRLVVFLGSRAELWLARISGIGLIAAALAIALRGELEPAQ